MVIQVKELGALAIVSYVGSLDALSAGEVEAAIKEHKNVVLDLSQVDFMSSAGLRAILNGLKNCREIEGDLRVAAAQPGVERVLNISGFTSIVKYFEDVNSAAQSFA
jgi:anti-sigma B factor antagonist